MKFEVKWKVGRFVDLFMYSSLAQTPSLDKRIMQIQTLFDKKIDKLWLSWAKLKFEVWVDVEAYHC